MCASCGCGMPDDDLGDDRNITWTQIEAAAAAGGISVRTVLANLERTAETQAPDAESSAGPD